MIHAFAKLVGVFVGSKVVQVPVCNTKLAAILCVGGRRSGKSAGHLAGDKAEENKTELHFEKVES